MLSKRIKIIESLLFLGEGAGVGEKISVAASKRTGSATVMFTSEDHHSYFAVQEV